MQIMQNGAEVFEDGNPAAVAYEAADYNIIDLQTLVSSVSVPSNMPSPFTHTDCIKQSDNTIDSDGLNDKNCIHISGSGVTVEIDATIILQFGSTHSSFTGVQRTVRPSLTGSAAIVYSNNVQQSSHGDTTRDYGTEVEIAYWDAQYGTKPIDAGNTVNALGAVPPTSGTRETLSLKYIYTTTANDTWFWLRITNYGVLGEFEDGGFNPMALPTLTVLGSQMTIRNV